MALHPVHKVFLCWAVAVGQHLVLRLVTVACRCLCSTQDAAFKHAEPLQELAELENALQEQHEVNASLQQAQGDLSAYETELETQLKLKDAETSQLKQELENLVRRTQVSRRICQIQTKQPAQSIPPLR